MAGQVPGPEAPKPLGDPHDWNAWEHYQSIHEKRMREHPFVLEDSLEWALIGTPGEVPELVALEGQVLCHKSVVVRVEKYLETRPLGAGRFQVRGLRYAYNAHLAGQHNVLRYDNGHAESPEEFHRHEYDPETGAEVSLKLITRRELPLFSEFLSEVAGMVEFDPYGAVT